MKSGNTLKSGLVNFTSPTCIVIIIKPNVNIVWHVDNTSTHFGK